MKKYVAMICVLMLLVLAACGHAKPASDDAAKPTATAEPSATPAPSAGKRSASTRTRWKKAPSGARTAASFWSSISARRMRKRRTRTSRTPDAAFQVPQRCIPPVFAGADAPGGPRDIYRRFS